MMGLGLSHPFPGEDGDKALFSPCLSDRANSTLPTSQLWEWSVHGSADSECLIHVPFFSPFPCSQLGYGIHTVGGESVCSPESVESSVDILDLRRSTVSRLTPGCHVLRAWAWPRGDGQVQPGVGTLPSVVYLTEKL